LRIIQSNKKSILIAPGFNPGIKESTETGASNSFYIRVNVACAEKTEKLLNAYFSALKFSDSIKRIIVNFTNRFDAKIYRSGT
jgi:hypothetical protein